MIRNTHSLRFVVPVSIVLVLLAGSVVQADQNGVGHPRLVEVFTTTESPVPGAVDINRDLVHREMELHVYELDGIQRIEARLSKGLTADPEQAKRIVISRIQQLDEANRTRMQRAAMGLAKAVQYGINRYPAIVFDGQVVVYGLTDLDAALKHYRAWRTGDRP